MGQLQQITQWVFITLGSYPKDIANRYKSIGYEPQISEWF